jgi:hypothetical protein
VLAESGDGLDEQLVRQLAPRARAEGLKLTGQGGAADLCGPKTCYLRPIDVR